MSLDKLTTDPAGFPMIWVDEIEAYLHYLPVTKIQFELFLCETVDSTFDADWYQRICELNPRVTPAAVRPANYWNALLTGILPNEAQRFARWCGEEYEIPGLKTWFDAYKALKRRPPEPIDWAARLPSLSERCRLLIAQLEQASEAATAEVGYERTLADQMLLRLGALEWVEDPGGQHSWGGMGELFPAFHGLLFTPDHGQSARPSNPESDRLDHYGIRLLRRPR